MGAGVGKVLNEERDRHRAKSSANRTARPSSGHSRAGPAQDTNEMPCSLCSVNFTILKRKLYCDECRRPHCSTCMPKDSSGNTNTSALTFSTKRRCPNCRILVSGNFTRNDLNVKFKVKDLKAFLDRRAINTTNCRERNDLVELVLQHSNSSSHFREQQEHEAHLHTLQERQLEHLEYSSRPSPLTQRAQPTNPSSSSQPTTPPVEQTMPNEAANEATTFNHTIPDGAENEALRERQQQEMRNTESLLQEELRTEETQAPASRNLAKIDDIQSLPEIEELTNRQLKEILVGNFVDYKGCVERGELVERVARLWREKQRMAAKGNIDDQPESEVCKICMDAMIDCVFLYCGHMVTCADCGHKLAECPVCRVNIVRVMRTFKA